MLTAVELDVLAGAAQGETSAATGRRLNRAAATVKGHRRSVLHKLGVRSIAHAVAVGYQHGLLGVQAQPDRLVITDGQRRALNKKASDVDVMRGLDPRTTKKAVLQQATIEFGRQVESFNDLDRREASLVLDLLERMLDGAAVEPGRGHADLITIGASA